MFHGPRTRPTFMCVVGADCVAPVGTALAWPRGAVCRYPHGEGVGEGILRLPRIRFFTDDPPVAEMDGSVHDSGSRPARACRGWVAGSVMATISFASEDALLAMPVAPCARSKPPTWSNYRR